MTSGLAGQAFDELEDVDRPWVRGIFLNLVYGSEKVSKALLLGCGGDYAIGREEVEYQHTLEDIARDFLMTGEPRLGWMRYRQRYLLQKH